MAIKKLEITNEIVYSWIVPIIKEYVFLTNISDNKFITICTPHPSARDGRWQKFLRISLAPVVTISKLLAVDKGSI
jgi:hypothetical protein